MVIPFDSFIRIRVIFSGGLLVNMKDRTYRERFLRAQGLSFGNKNPQGCDINGFWL